MASSSAKQCLGKSECNEIPYEITFTIPPSFWCVTKLTKSLFIIYFSFTNNCILSKCMDKEIQRTTKEN